MTHTPVQSPKAVRWTVAEYERLASRGFFKRRRVELVNGRIIEMPPKLEPHVASVSLSAKALARAFGDGYYIRQEAPLRQGSRSKPEPDIAVVRGSEWDYVEAGCPSDALLVVEVSEKTLRYDRGKKAALYARHGIADYWIVNLVDRQLEVHREPIADASHQHAYRYATILVFKPGQSVSPLHAQEKHVAVAELMPWRHQL
ncbi:MAG TPA: Uma2 family endonuclease [Tepidisphaeraceae bacterium]|nr:Uma2 family endonuclease [Tepidisphaeraceae bacterium]